MKMEILKEKEEKLLNRKELILNINFEKVTPKKDDVKKEISEHLKLNPELLKIYNIKQGFGERKAQVTAYVYDSKENMNKVEIRKKKVKKEAKKEEIKKE